MRTCTAIAASFVAVSGAFAQAPPAAPNPVPGTVRCAPVQPPSPGTAGAGTPSPMTGQSREPLSDRLAQSDGVICPPAVTDHPMQKLPPDTGTTPVIPPPGSPGGDPTVRPK